MRAVRLVVWSAGAALSTVMLIGAIRGGDVIAWYLHGDAFSPSTGSVFLIPTDQATAFYAGALVSLTLGVLVWDRRPDSRTGLLLTAFSIAGLVGDPVVFPGSRLAMTVGLATFGLAGVLAAHLILSYPTGRLTSRLERGFVAVGYGFALVYSVPLLLFYSPQTPHKPWFPECLSCAEPLTHVAWRNLTGLRRVLDGVLVVLIVIFMVLLLRKLVRAVPVARNVALPLAVVAFVAAARFALLIGLRLFAPSSHVLTSPAWFWSSTFAGSRSRSRSRPACSGAGPGAARSRTWSSSSSARRPDRCGRRWRGRSAIPRWSWGSGCPSGRPTSTARVGRSRCRRPARHGR